ncbi:hypothetical protein UFOVP1655_57 [uncultured Caudovirales phage]|uniref:Uncharacterized protein n=1 Tax=uncultured Caudovirales phage TaxID=2100421 RepID=A0A6J5T4R1_9CAUD|nr:hypothetical protein UFOVP1655_57 [uncultured Caudovirales phage]
MTEENVYTIPESQLFRLLEICSTRNKCKAKPEACECLTGIPKPKRKPQIKRKK